MRLQRVAFLLAVVAIACFSLTYLRKRIQSPFPSPSPANAPTTTPGYQSLKPLEYYQQQAASQGTFAPEKPHPIARLTQDGAQQFEQVRSRQSRSLSDAVQEYKRRYNMHPPPHFDKWFEFARARGVQMIDEYDTIYHSLLPFWGLEPRTIRSRARETLGFDNQVMGLLVRGGKVSLTEGGDDWQREATVGMMKGFVQYLPDMDLVFNLHDEPRVIVPSEDLQRLVAAAKERVIPASLKNPSPVNTWSARPSDVNKGDRIEEVRTTRFNRFAHQPTWTNSRTSCPVDSPARSLEENPADDTNGYSYGELGFIYNTTAASDICSTPSLRYTYGFFDRPNAFDVVHDLFPVFSQSKISSFQDIIYPSPWYWARKVPYEVDKDTTWDAKQDKLYWRGSTTGGFSRAGGWRRQHRQQFVSNANALDTTKVLTRNENDAWVSKRVNRRDYQDLFDVRFTFVGQCDPEDCAQQGEYFGVAEHAGQQDAWAYKYLVDIDGNAFSGRFYAFLQSNSLVSKIAIFREWHDEWLKPWVHYLPLSLRGEEYAETVRYFANEEAGKAVAPKLAQQGKEWAQKVLRNEDFEAWFFRLLLEYGRLIDDNREKMGFPTS